MTLDLTAGGGSQPGRAARVVAFHLPQFHPIPENDEWWGPGFTEWTNVARARSLFRGHQQPLIPGELGFYDMRLEDTRRQQHELAAAHGVEAFCYWHYWFAGRRLLDEPLHRMLESSEPAHPYCLAWANQTWSGIWHGAADRILMEQTYPGPEDDQAHFDYLLPFFEDPRYLRVAGRPVFYLFNPADMPDRAAWTARWREMASRAGLDGLYLIAEISDLTGGGPVYLNPVADGFDAGVYVRIPARQEPMDEFRMKLRRKVRGGPQVFPHRRALHDLPEVLDADRVLPCVYPNWDNTPRSGRGGTVLTGSTPEIFEGHLRTAVDRVRERAAGERLVFVKSWNEWAEGNHIEPDTRWGRAWLEAVRRVVG